MILFKAICWNLAYLWLFWAAFVFTMAVYRVFLAKRLSIYAKILASPLILLAAVMDVAANPTIAAILCLELPKEWLVTQRFERYLKWSPTSVKGINKWRYLLAKFTCNDLLNPFDPDGNHCGNLTPAQSNTTPIMHEI